jgi:hypothetical protein
MFTWPACCTKTARGRRLSSVRDRSARLNTRRKRPAMPVACSAASASVSRGPPASPSAFSRCTGPQRPRRLGRPLASDPFFLASALAAYQQRRGLDDAARADAGGPAAAAGQEPPYPRISVVSRGSAQAPTVRHIPASADKTLRIIWQDDNSAGLAGGLREALRGGGCAAVIRNTVRSQRRVPGRPLCRRRRRPCRRSRRSTGWPRSLSWCAPRSRGRNPLRLQPAAGRGQPRGPRRLACLHQVGRAFGVSGPSLPDRRQVVSGPRGAAGRPPEPQAEPRRGPRARSGPAASSGPCPPAKSAKSARSRR